MSSTADLESVITAPILIVGAGPAGLALALTLRRNNVPVRIIDKEGNYHVGSRGSGLHPRTLEVYKFIGVLPDVQKRALDLPKFRSYKLPGGTEVLRTWDLIDKVETTPDVPIANATVLGQNYMESIFRQHLERYNSRVELAKELIDLQQDDTGVTARIHHNVEDTVETYKASYVIGADGAKSMVRKLLGLKFLGETREAEALIVGDAVVHNIDAHHWHLWSDPSSTSVAIRPTILGDNSAPFNFVIAGHTFDPTTLLEPDALIKLIREVTNRTELEFGAFSWISYFRPNIRVVDNFSKGKVFIVGDAAHAHPPTGGQGLNSSVQDSFNLGWKLALVYKGLAGPKLLETYNDERLPVIAEMLRQTAGLYVGAFGKEKGERKELPFSGWFRNRALFMLGINYRWSDIVLDERGLAGLDLESLKAHSYGGYEDGLRAGDRAPEAPGLLQVDTGKTISLFDLLDPTRHTVLIFVNSDSIDDAKDFVNAGKSLRPTTTLTAIVTSSESALRSSEVDLVLRDQDGYAYKHYDINGEKPTTVIIRPDGYVGGICISVDGFKNYFNGIFGINN